MAVFAFIGFYTLDLVVTRRKSDPRATLFLVAATALPAVMSIIMLTISLTKLGTTCKLCVCIYIASALVLVGADRRVASRGSRRPGRHVAQWRRAAARGRRRHAGRDIRRAFSSPRCSASASCS